MSEVRLEIEECLNKILENINVIADIENVDITNCYNRIVACDIKAPMSVPPFPKSAMDGYAVFSGDVACAGKDTPVNLIVKGELLAGDYKEFKYEPMTAIRVMTGAFIPDGYDAVIKQEDTDYGDNEVSVYATSKPFSNYCKIGEDIKEGMLLIKSGTKLNSAHIGILASVGMKSIPVQRKIKVSVISTGTEVTEVGKTLSKGKIYNNTAYMINASLMKEGIDVVDIITCVDDEEMLQERIKETLKRADVVITTGAVSVGKKDIIPKVLESIGANILFRKANIQPGTPTTASIYDGKLILSLSGNPYAAIANFEIYFWSVASKLSGDDSLNVVKTNMELSSEYNKVNKQRRMVRAFAKDGKVYLPSNVHSSSVISNMTECNCFIDMEPMREVKIGDMVRVRYIKGL